MADFVEEELQIMQERSSEQPHKFISNGIDIEDPIKTLNLVPIVTANLNMTVKETVELLNSKKIGCALIIDDNGETVGIFTERDFLRKLALANVDMSKVKVKDYMTPDPEILSEEDPIAFALNRMSDGSYRHIPITRNGDVKYMLSVKDIVDHIAFTYRKTVLNLPPNLKQRSSQYGG